jgi:hypothetical protein
MKINYCIDVCITRYVVLGCINNSSLRIRVLYRLTMATAKSIAGLLRPNFNALVFIKYPLSDYVASM